MINQYKSYELPLENGENIISKKKYQKNDECNNVSNNIIIQNCQGRIKSLQIQSLNKLNTKRDCKDEILLANGSNTGRINKKNDDKNEYNNIIYQKGKGFTKINHLKINGKEKKSSLNNGGINNDKNGNLSSDETRKIGDEICQTNEISSPILRSKIIIRKRMDNNFRIKNILKINEEKKVKEKIKKKDENKKKQKKEDDRKEKEKVRVSVSEDEEEEEEDDDESEEDEEIEETYSESDSEDSYKNYNNKYNILKRINGNNKYQYIKSYNTNIENNEVNNLNKNNILESTNNSSNDTNNNINNNNNKNTNQIQKANIIYDEAKIDDNKNKILNNIEIQKKLIYHIKPSNRIHNYFSYLTNDNIQHNNLLSPNRKENEKEKKQVKQKKIGDKTPPPPNKKKFIIQEKETQKENNKKQEKIRNVLKKIINKINKDNIIKDNENKLNKSSDCIDNDNDNNNNNVKESKNKNKSKKKLEFSKTNDYLKENIIDLQNEFDEIQKIFNKKKESTQNNKQKKVYKKEINENNEKNNNQCEEIFIEKITENSRSRSLINLYNADEDYYNNYYYDDIQINKNNENNNNSKNDPLNNKENNSSSSQELKSFSSKSNGLYNNKKQNKDDINPINNVLLRKNSKVKINTEIAILKYNINEKMMDYTPTEENKKLSKNKNRKKKEGILKNKNGRSRTLLSKSNLNQNGDIELNLQKYDNRSADNDMNERSDISFDVNTPYNTPDPDLFFNDYEFNKKEIKQLIEKKVIKDKLMKKENDLLKEKNNNKKDMKDKNKLYNEDYFDYEIDYSEKKNKYQKKESKKKSKKNNKTKQKHLNRSFDAMIYF